MIVTDAVKPIFGTHFLIDRLKHLINKKRARNSSAFFIVFYDYLKSRKISFPFANSSSAINKMNPTT